MADSNGKKKTFEERLEAIAMNLELAGLTAASSEKRMAANEAAHEKRMAQLSKSAATHDRQIGKMIAVIAAHDRQIGKLLKIGLSHNARNKRLEGGSPA